MNKKLKNPNLIDILACPDCKGSLDYLKDKDLFACKRCKLAFPINDDGVPVFLKDEALPYTEEKKS